MSTALLSTNPGTTNPVRAPRSAAAKAHGALQRQAWRASTVIVIIPPAHKDAFTCARNYDTT